MGNNIIEVYDDLNQALTFGKYRGQPVSVLANDKNYCDWLMAQDWFRQRYQNVYNVIINNFSKPEDTPEHNALQAKFLNNIFLRQLCCVMFPRDQVIDSIKEQIAENDRDLSHCRSDNPDRLDYMHDIIVLDDLLKRFDYSKFMSECLSIKELEFEVYGWDVGFVPCFECDDCGIWVKRQGSTQTWGHIYFEVKPVIGDDYPSILRQMKVQRERTQDYRAHTYYLIYHSFEAIGATEEQVAQIFNQSGFQICRFDQVESFVC